MRDNRMIVAKSGVIQYVNEDVEESSGLFLQVKLEQGIDVADERINPEREHHGYAVRIV